MHYINNFIDRCICCTAKSWKKKHRKSIIKTKNIALKFPILSEYNLILSYEKCIFLEGRGIICLGPCVTIIFSFLSGQRVGKTAQL